jgi:hypothetical protein
VIRRATAAQPIRATRESARALLGDLGQIGRWLPGVTGARVLTREGDISVVELEAQGPPLMFEVISMPPGGARFEQVNRRRGIAGSWQLRDTADGELELSAELRAPASLLDFAAGRRLRTALEAGLAAVATQLERPPTAQLATFRRALAIVRRGDVIEAHVGDEVIELFRIGGGG